jgi:hypothetical protein
MRPSLARGYHREEERFGNGNITVESINIFSHTDVMRQIMVQELQALFAHYLELWTWTN